MQEPIGPLVEDLRTRRQQHCLPPRARASAKQIAERTLALLFPHFSDDLPCGATDIELELRRLHKSILDIRSSLAPHYALPPESVADDFLNDLPSLYQRLILDAEAILHGDPAAVSVDEVILAYPGFFAIALHRIAHDLHRAHFPLLPRLISEYAHRRTGIDIHPGATIGRSFFIDHGTGVVVGETAEIGNGVKIYQGVTLGAQVVQKELASTKRHPTIEDNVVIYANATILGGDTVIGHDTIVGANAWVIRSVPPFAFVGRDADVRVRRSEKDTDLEFYI